MSDAPARDEPDDAAFLRAWLAARDERCPNCRYVLRGLTATHCPECGLALVLRVGLEKPRQALLVLGVTGLASGLGFHALVLLWGVSQGAPGSDLVPLVLGVITCGALLPVWTCSARHLRRVQSGIRWLWALLCFVPGIVFFLVFIAHV
ncbi:MAG: hypothetical protein KF817_00445 [Phycisphaeraceae bacterium]|nr:hypothetical protein [Phycisphaeraceae bacterium]